jgi:hypothetical protein
MARLSIATAGAWATGLPRTHAVAATAGGPARLRPRSVCRDARAPAAAGGAHPAVEPTPKKKSIRRRRPDGGDGQKDRNRARHVCPLSKVPRQGTQPAPRSSQGSGPYRTCSGVPSSWRSGPFEGGTGRSREARRRPSSRPVLRWLAGIGEGDVLVLPRLGGDLPPFARKPNVWAVDHHAGRARPRGCPVTQHARREPCSAPFR